MSAISERVFLSVVTPSLKSTDRANAGGSAALTRSEAGVATSSAVRVDPTMLRIVEQSGSVSRLATEQAAPTANLAPGNGKYAMFVDAVLALRLDEAAAAELPSARMAELKKAAAEIFQIRTGIPRERDPIEVLVEQREKKAAQSRPADPVREDSDRGDAAVPVARPDEGLAVGIVTTETEATGMDSTIQATPIPEPVVVPEAADPVVGTDAGAFPDTGVDTPVPGASDSPAGPKAAASSLSEPVA